MKLIDLDKLYRERAEKLPEPDHMEVPPCLPRGNIGPKGKMGK